ncbi:hypothetical protein OC25_12320 [Pedobacter kyungheensis]|uniref:Uncharacterized protein n=1 Tax=Pedobacter kyungheensis TaxID=1069985 RepID=A0A0C1G0G5_9SPHI|nr:hypothetical protein [Pedobacter kyungheensis]KIA93554.1 hypothetical protein OC25_12320 [Pedobacter kyungheensis]
MPHTFHIPVLGLAYSVDTPLKVAQFGISSVVSIVDDELCERMRKYHCELNYLPYTSIDKTVIDSRAKRITAYLNLMQQLIHSQIANLKNQVFEAGTMISRYFELQCESSPLSKTYKEMLKNPAGRKRTMLESQLRKAVEAGNIDVNIMAKVDKVNFVDDLDLGNENTDALAALRGFANSRLKSAVVISAGLNPRLFTYLENFAGFYPDENGHFSKKIILKVSDYRSAMVQAKMLAKKGLWVAEFRIESGLNCGGHAFATEGFLLGPILHEFKANRLALSEELWAIYTAALQQKNIYCATKPIQKITAQGGIGTAAEHNHLLQSYGLDAAGWGSPFLLVEEATNVDSETLKNLTEATESDFYLSNASPLGVPFNNFRKSTAEQERLHRIAKSRPGSPCTKKYLCTNTEFTEQPICTASRQYQHLKIREIKASATSPEEQKKQIDAVTEKTCLCEGLCASVYLKDEILKPKESKAVSICPGPNLAYFSKKYNLKEMVDHIYGKVNLLEGVNRPNLFVKELGLYIDYFKKELQHFNEDFKTNVQQLHQKKQVYLTRFYNQLLNGVEFYRTGFQKADADLKIWGKEQIELFEKAVLNIQSINTQSLNLGAKV